ncbi:MAG: hypothetical protein Q9220_007565 [cf. Caloplaca sp. 1 TL-2023]
MAEPNPQPLNPQPQDPQPPNPQPPNPQPPGNRTRPRIGAGRRPIRFGNQATFPLQDCHCQQLGKRGLTVADAIFIDDIPDEPVEAPSFRRKVQSLADPDPWYGLRVVFRLGLVLDNSDYCCVAERVVLGEHATALMTKALVTIIAMIGLRLPNPLTNKFMLQSLSPFHLLLTPKSPQNQKI